MKEYILVFDGGSKGNPGLSYGSFRIQAKGRKPARPVRLNFGHGTNNEAEYKALIAGLEALIAEIEAEGSDPAVCLIDVRGDSQLVLNQLRGDWKVKNLRMRDLWDEADALLDRFSDRRFQHQSRSRTVDILGHGPCISLVA
jgi:ribonuclease HI